MAPWIELSISEFALLHLFRNFSSWVALEWFEHEDEEEADEEEDGEVEFFVECRLIANEYDLLWRPAPFSVILSLLKLLMPEADILYLSFWICPKGFFFPVFAYLLKSSDFITIASSAFLAAAAALDSLEQPVLPNKDLR